MKVPLGVTGGAGGPSSAEQNATRVCNTHGCLVHHQATAPTGMSESASIGSSDGANEARAKARPSASTNPQQVCRVKPMTTYQLESGEDNGGQNLFTFLCLVIPLRQEWQFVYSRSDTI